MVVSEGLFAVKLNVVSPMVKRYDAEELLTNYLAAGT
jgi:hypothetical protein